MKILKKGKPYNNKSINLLNYKITFVCVFVVVEKTSCQPDFNFKTIENKYYFKIIIVLFLIFNSVFLKLTLKTFNEVKYI